MVPRRAVQRAVILILAFLILLFTGGNSPAPWAACEGKSQGDSCTQVGSCFAVPGVCVFEADCGYGENHCLLCKSPSVLPTDDRVPQ